MVHDLRCHRLAAAGGQTPIVRFDFLNRDAVAIRAFVTIWPFCQKAGNVVGRNRRALVVEAESIGGQVVEPNALS
jgi:hypothetical protein